MWIVLPVTAWILLFLLFNKNNCWRSSILLGALVWGVILTAITEFLNLFQSINFWSLLVDWGLINIILVVFYIKVNGKRWERFQFNHQIPLNLMVLLVGVAFIAATTGLIALVAPPNNWDSMSYHMARVVHWIQNHSVAHYPTSYLPQLYHSPWAEFAIMHFQILSGGDRFANLVQWFSMVGSLVGVSLIAQQLGAGLPGQVLSAVFTVTLPLGILQSSNTKNDYVVTFWIVCLAYFVLVASKSKINLGGALTVGMSLGLAIFTKGTGYIYCLPFCIWFIWASLKNLRQQAWKVIVLLGSVALLINFGIYTRNFDLFGTPIFSPPEYKIEVISLPSFISNIIKNMALHMAIPLDVVNNNVIEQGIRRLHQILGVDINDPRITTPGLEFGIEGLSNFEDTAGNPIHFYLIVLGIAICLSWRNLRRQPNLTQYLITVVSAFLLFCLLIKWQTWQSRLHLTVFVLFSPFMGIVFSTIFNKRKYIYLAIFILTISLFWVFFNTSKPIFDEQNIFNLSRIEQYFSIRANLEDDYVGAVDIVKGRQCSQVGLSLRPDAWEYPLWVLLKDGNPSLQIEQVNVKNVSIQTSSKHSYDKFLPCAIISVGHVPNSAMLTKYGVYAEKWSSNSSFESVKVFVPKAIDPQTEVAR
jgi:4-amino-4-deoxy-L-arabinose transferase-like glycosyltransferase